MLSCRWWCWKRGRDELAGGKEGSSDGSPLLLGQYGEAEEEGNGNYVGVGAPVWRWRGCRCPLVASMIILSLASSRGREGRLLERHLLTDSLDKFPVPNRAHATCVVREGFLSWGVECRLGGRFHGLVEEEKQPLASLDLLCVFGGGAVMGVFARAALVMLNQLTCLSLAPMHV